MARPKEFDQEKVLDEAVEIFWAKGYEATSMQDLVDGMGIQRGSLYGTFGSKQQLFLMALRRYGEVIVKKLLEILESRPSGLESIELFFGQLVEHLLTAGPLRGCLVTNSAIERGLTDEATQRQVCRLLKAIEKGFYQTLLKARENNEIPAIVDLKSTAEFLTSSMQGLLVVGKVRSDREVLENIKRATLSVLKSSFNRKGFNMTTFAVKRNLPGITMDQLGAAQKAAIETGRQMTGEGTEVKYLRSNFYPGDSSCTCLFEASDRDAVKQLNDRAKLRYTEITEVLDLVP